MIYHLNENLNVILLLIVLISLYSYIPKRLLDQLDLHFSIVVQKIQFTEQYLSDGHHYIPFTTCTTLPKEA